MFTINFLLALFLSYLVGSIPSGVIVAKIFNLGDVRKQGSGNIGGTNIARIGGKKLGLLTIGFDVLKGILPISMLEHYTTQTQIYKIFHFIKSCIKLELKNLMY